jgi:hypothetical protein
MTWRVKKVDKATIIATMRAQINFTNVQNRMRKD